MAQGEAGRFVDEGEESEVAGVHAGGFEDEPEFFAEGAVPEEHHHAVHSLVLANIVASSLFSLSSTPEIM